MAGRAPAHSGRTCRSVWSCPHPRPSGSARRRLAELRGPQVAELLTDRSILVQPVGAIEQHGPHLPLDTDLVVATEVAEAAVAE